MKLRADGVSWREIDGEMVILDLRKSTYLAVNSVGTTLLRLLAAERSADELADALVDEFAIDRSTAQDDVRAFLDDLQRRDLLENAH